MVFQESLSNIKTSSILLLFFPSKHSYLHTFKHSYLHSNITRSSFKMTHSGTQATVNDQPSNEAPSIAQVNPFNSAARDAFYLMLDSRKDESRERMTAPNKHKYIRWLTEAVPERLGPADSKKRSWLKSEFTYDRGKLWRLPTKVVRDPREVISEDLIWDTIIRVHEGLGHAGQNATAIKVNHEYYGIARHKVLFLIKLCEICHRKAHSKSKGPLKSIVTTRLFERVQIDLIDMTSTPDGEYVWICHMEDHFSKFHMLFPMANKEAPTVARHIHTWISILGVFEILQSDNGTEFKGICLELMRRYGVKVINGRPRTPRTQGLIEQANGTVKTRIASWKREHGSTHWGDGLEVCMRVIDLTLFFFFFSSPIFCIDVSQTSPNFYLSHTKKRAY